jgi:hypothetical protein
MRRSSKKMQRHQGGRKLLLGFCHDSPVQHQKPNKEDNGTKPNSPTLYRLGIVCVLAKSIDHRTARQLAMFNRAALIAMNPSTISIPVGNPLGATWLAPQSSYGQGNAICNLFPGEAYRREGLVSLGTCSGVDVPEAGISNFLCHCECDESR